MALNLKPLREKNGLSGYQVADALGVTHVSYYAWETGKTYPTADKLPYIAALFHCSIDELYSPGPTLPDTTSLHEEVWRCHGV